MVIPHFTGSLDERMEKLRGILSGELNLRLVGSSFGGLMATLFAQENPAGVERIVLLAPALNLVRLASGEEGEIPIPVTIYHGTNDQVIPLSVVEPVAKKLFTNLSFHTVDDDHFLHRTFRNIDWDSLLA